MIKSYKICGILHNSTTQKGFNIGQDEVCRFNTRGIVFENDVDIPWLLSGEFSLISAIVHVFLAQ